MLAPSTQTIQNRSKKATYMIHYGWWKPASSSSHHCAKGPRRTWWWHQTSTCLTNNYPREFTLKLSLTTRLRHMKAQPNSAREATIPRKPLTSELNITQYPKSLFAWTDYMICQKITAKDSRCLNYNITFTWSNVMALYWQPDWDKKKRHVNLRWSPRGL